MALIHWLLHVDCLSTPESDGSQDGRQDISIHDSRAGRWETTYVVDCGKSMRREECSSSAWTWMEEREVDAMDSHSKRSTQLESVTLECHQTDWCHCYKCHCSWCLSWLPISAVWQLPHRVLLLRLVCSPATPQATYLGAGSTASL